ncbi:MAG TPA: hypothetical protein VFJ16_05940 [Longimicrobium sp.]|nr:hypothetical protein [Longimicrobium sp.]
MRSLKTLLLLPLLAALAACGDNATAPTDQDLLGTWSIEPTPALLPDGGIRQMTVQFGSDGGYTLETATYAPGIGVRQQLSYGKSVGSVTAAGGALRFHPAGAVSLGRTQAIAANASADGLNWGLRQPVTYQVVGNHLVLHLPAPSLAPVVLTRQGY